MTKTLRADFCIVGTGAAAVAAMAEAAAAGASVIAVDPRPADAARDAAGAAVAALVAAARQVHEARRAAAFGSVAIEPDFARIAGHVEATVAAIRSRESRERLAALGARVLTAEPRFRDRRTLVAGGVAIRARHFVIATGSTPLVPPVDGLDEVGFLTPDTLHELVERPGHLVILGGDPAAVELAQAYRRLGAEVTLVEPAAPLAGWDAEMAAMVLRRLAAEGVTIRANARPVAVERLAQGGIRVEVATETASSSIEATHLLLAAGRVPDIAGLDLDRAGIVHDGAGIAVSPALQTSNGRVHAVGREYGPLAGPQAARLVRRLLSAGKAPEAAPVPRLLLTDPGLAHVGMTESEAVGRHPGLRILRWPYADNLRALAERRTDGHVKVLADAAGRLLGATVAGAEAGEAIALFVLALSKGFTVADLDFDPAAPTFGEIGNRAAMAYPVGGRQTPIVRKLAALRRLFR